MAWSDVLLLGGLAVRVVSFTRAADETGGGAKRTLSGRLRGGPLWTARAWRAEVYAVTDNDADAIYARASASADITVSGTAIGGSVLCRVTVTGDQYQRDGDGWSRTLSLDIRESIP